MDGDDHREKETVIDDKMMTETETAVTGAVHQ